MKFIQKEHWTKYNEDGDEVIITKEEYEKAVLPRLQEYLKDPTEGDNYAILEGAIDANATAMDFFLANKEDLEELKEKIMSDYQDECIEEIECEIDYRHWFETIPVEY